MHVPRLVSGSGRFSVEITERNPGTDSSVCGITVRTWEADHPSGAPALLLRMDLGANREAVAVEHTQLFTTSRHVQDPDGTAAGGQKTYGADKPNIGP